MIAVAQIMQQAVNHHEAGRLAEAEALYRKVLEQIPNQPDVLCRLGMIASQVGRHEAALGLIQQAIANNPPQAAYHACLGQALLMARRFDEAEAALRQALALSPDNSDILCQLGNVARENQKLNLASEYYRQALHIRPDNAPAYCALGLTYRSLGNFDAAIDCYKKAIELKPDFIHAHTGLISMCSYHVLCSCQEMLDIHRDWDRIHGQEGRQHRFTHRRDQAPDRRLRIGYVSPDFREHAVSYFIEPLLAAHDHEAVEVYCYAEVRQPDAVTERLQGYADVWRSTLGMSDADVAAMIHQDRIDILVDLIGHAYNGVSRIRAFTFKPAPIQATYLGYFSTTGLESMDYWITDHVLHPDNSPELASETLLRLPRCCMAYLPPQDAPAVTHIPAADGQLTFGCFNNIAKAGPETFSLWGEILTRVPHSRLLLKSRQFADDQLCENMLRTFTDHGIAPDRIIMRPKTSGVREHLMMYREMDIALDVMPRTGGTTTMEALWMGVPVITLAGERFIERLSASMLIAAGLDDLVTYSATDYIDRAVALADDRQRLRALQGGLRERIAASPLCDGRDLARTFESAYRRMWQDWLAGSSD